MTTLLRMFCTFILRRRVLPNRMKVVLPWLKYCINHFEVTNIGANYDLLPLFDASIDEPI